MTQYARGRAKEWDVCKRLRALGWLAQRSAGSHGLWDVVAMHRSQPVKMIQVKYTARPAGVPHDANTLEFAKWALSMDVPVDCEIWVYRKGTAAPEVWVPQATLSGPEWLKNRVHG